MKRVREGVEYAANGPAEERIMLVVGDLRDAMRLYDEGMRFTSINLGNIHHEGRRITPSIIVDTGDEDIMERFEALGVEIEIRDVPRNAPVEYRRR